MKKLILLLLISGGLSAQVVIPKSTTTFSNISATGTLKVASTSTLVGKVRIGANTAPSATLDVTGTMSVSGTSALTGAVTTNSIYGAVSSLVLGSVSNNNNITIRYGNMDFTGAGHSGNGSNPSFYFVTPSHYSITASTNVPAFKITGATRGWLTGAIPTQYENHFTAPTYTAAGASTITTAAGLYVAKPIMGTNMTATNIYGIATDGNLLLGSAGLTGGNTGTVAVLSDAVFGMNFMAISSNPADATTYFFGNLPYGIQTVTYGAIYIPYNATLVGWTFNGVPGVTASTESATLQIAVNSSTTNLSTGIQLNSATNTYTATGLSQSVTAGDKIEPKLVCPTWATNPTAVAFGITLWFVRRQ